jgi:periplasmic divalent cation tolerance protein
MLPLLVVTTVATRDAAQELAHALVDLRLAACAQISQIESVYRWQGAVHDEREFRVLFKTRASMYAEVEAAILARHPYELPAIHAIATTQAYAPFVEWVDANSAG